MTQDDQTTDQARGPVGKAVDRMQDAVGAVIGQASAAVSASNDAAFVEAASMGDLFIVQAAQLGLERSQRQELRALASTLIDDHQRAFATLRVKAEAAGVAGSIASGLDQRRAGMLDNLRQAGDDFDTVFLTQQAAAHREARTLHEGFARDGQDAGLRGLADGSAPKLAQHLEMIEKLKA